MKKKTIDKNSTENEFKSFMRERVEAFGERKITDENLRELFFRDNVSGLGKAQLVSSAHGKIEILLVAEGKDFVGYYLDKLLDVKSKHTKIKAHVFEENSNKQGVDFWKGKSPYVSNWVQDHFISFSLPDDSTMLAQPLKTRSLGNVKKRNYPKGKINSEFGDDDIKIHENYFPFELEGGNILVGDSFFFIGRDVFDIAFEAYFNELNEECFKDFHENLNEYFFPNEGVQSPPIKNRWWFDKMEILMNRILDPSKKMIKISNEVDAHFSLGLSDPRFFTRHLDLFITLGGEIEVEDGSQYLIFLGKPVNATPWKERGDTFFKDVEKWFKKTKNEIERSSSGNPTRKFKVVELKLPCVYEHNSWNLYSYSNCLVEIFEESQELKKKVFFPSYEYIYPDLNGERFNILGYYNFINSKTFDDFGFEVEFIKGLRVFMEDYSSIHCLTKDLKRSKLINYERN